MLELRNHIQDTVLSMPKANSYTESKIKHYEWREMNFCWLVEHLLPPNSKVRGCHIKIPDLVFLKGGKVVLRVKTDNNGFLVNFKNPKRLKKTDIRSQFPTIVRERRRRNLNSSDIEDILLEEQDLISSASNLNTIAQESKEESSINFNKGDAFKDINLAQNKLLQGNYYRDIVIVQFNSKAYPEQVEEKATLDNEDNLVINKYLRPMNEFCFLEMMETRPNSESWKKIDMIQTWIKSKIGIGKHIVIDFFARINKN